MIHACLAVVLCAAWACGAPPVRRRADAQTRGSPRAEGRSASRTERPAGGADSLGTTADATPSPPGPVILFLGTSLTAGLGVDPESAYPAVIQRRLDSMHAGWRVRNAGESGETSAGALRRLPWLLQHAPAVLVLETGANDGLRGLDVDSTRATIEAIIHAVRARDSATRIVLAGMEAPPNMGPRFTARFRALFPELARREHLPLIAFLLAGVAGIDSLNQPDGIHPTPRGHRIVAETVWRVIEPLVREGR